MQIDQLEVECRGRWPRVARLRDEYYEYAEDPAAFVAALKRSPLRADVFSFLQPTVEREPKHGYLMEKEGIAVIPITTYEHWWEHQLKGKTRNMVRKAEKKGVEVRVVPFDDALVAGIVEIYHETPVRQGKPFAHYHKDFETIKADHATFLDRSEFIGAYAEGKLIGFVKLVHGRGVSNLMQILSKVSERDKAPTNALIAKAVERCAARKVGYLHYGLWSGRSLGSFKVNNAFERLDVFRYYVPLNFKGSLLLQLRMHQRLSQRLPQSWIDRLAGLRTRWNSLRLGRGSA